MYSKHCEDVSAKSEYPPLGEGILIFDEVKVQSKVMWNSKNNEIIGLAVSEEELRSLHDVYASVKDEEGLQMTSYILQFLWRDLSSNFDVIGPYFTSESVMEAKFITSCVLDAMLAFEFFRFSVRGLVCNGSSCNLSFMKGLCGVSGQFSSTSRGDYAVPASFTSPFSGNRVWLIICPSHQVSNCDCLCVICMIYIMYILSRVYS